MIALGIMIFIIVVFSLILSLKITVDITASKNHNCKFQKDIKIAVANHKIDISKFSKKKKPEYKKTGTEKKEIEFEEKDNFYEKLVKLRTNIARGKYTYLLSKRYVRKKIFVENVDFAITFGLDDAAHTGIATGAVWGSIYNIFAFADSLFTIKSHKFDVNPIFNGEYLDLNFSAKVNTRIINILLILFAVFVNYIKTGKNL